MSIKQIGPSLWALDVRAWKNGKVYHKRERLQGGRKAAEARQHEIKKSLMAKAAEDDCSLKLNTFEKAINFYLQRVDVKDSKHYFDRLKADLGNRRLNELAEYFDRWLLIMRQTNSKQTGKPLSAATLNRFIGWSKAALNYCVAYKVINENPLAHIKKTKEIPRDLVLNDLDRKNLFNVLEREAPYLVPLVRFALLVPCRTGELIQMQRKDLDLFNNAIRVGCGIMKNKELASWKPIPPEMRDYFASLPVESEYLFPRKQGRCYLPINGFPYHVFRRCLKLAGLKGWRLHDARHEAVSGMLNNNTPETIVCMVAGWTSTAMLRTYYHKSGLQSLKLVRWNNGNIGQSAETAHLTAHSG